MRKMFAPRYDELRWDRLIFWVLIMAGVLTVVATDGGTARPFFSLGAFVLSLTFVLVYSRRTWQTTYAGRAAMLSMVVTSLYTANTTLILWWPRDEYGYPFWTEATEFVYFAIALAALYKLRALTRPNK